MLAIWKICAVIAWTPAWNFNTDTEVLAHYLYEDNLPAIVLWEPEADICRQQYDVAVTYSVAGLHSSQGQLHIGPESGDLVVVWPSEPIPEPSGIAMFLAGALAIFYVGRRRRRKDEKHGPG